MRICWRHPAEFDLLIQTDGCSCGSGEALQPGAIRLTESQLEDPAALAAIFACALARRQLDRYQVLEGLPNQEWMIELTTVVLGLGIFTANATVSEKHEHCGRSCHTSLSRHNNLPAWATAYAMALHAWLRGEERPNWGNYLRDDAVYAFFEGLRYLTRTEDSLLRPDNLHQGNRSPTVHQLIDQLQQGSLSQHVAALWNLAHKIRQPTRRFRP